MVLSVSLLIGIWGIKYILRPIRRFTFNRLTGLVDVPKRDTKVGEAQQEPSDMKRRILLSQDGVRFILV